MDAKTHWVFDNFFPEADFMRQRIDEHFSEEFNNKHNIPFSKRCIWNYWYINNHYTYLRADPVNVFPKAFERFMSHLRAFALREFGMEIRTNSLLSMYVNGCGQVIHNDARHGYLAYVFSLTRWKARGFEGGETVLYKFGPQSRLPGASQYDLAEPWFNRLIVFDDRVPHAVRPIQGTMRPSDARFVIHGHMQSPNNIAFIEGGLQNVDVTAQWQEIKQRAAEIIKKHGYHGFMTFKLDIDPAGAVVQSNVRHQQLWAAIERPGIVEECAGEVKAAVAQMRWPDTQAGSSLVFPLCG